ncbi:MAG: MFS transporter [Inconstantimicrobium porci]|uniref:MFS transporter n=1 Tax=Inconstantimicrobium porci TaxID=2652291 RepID=A0A7X2MYB8_9CLOT|nr:MFS transporter [Inconstantimicrobium porci]MDD6772009.1 MFS transporter [Inconstantimicrobium porci]MDY5913438.1 MFS transporter [Inconstantimicrobium porci]MSR91346.1 MFS transporter [Inconstantimicrobium porci]
MENVKQKSSYRAVLKEKNYLIFIMANLISRFGDSVDCIAYEWMVYKITNSASLMALIFGVNAIPTMVLQPFAGVLVERFNKKKVIVLCDFGRGITVLIIALLYLSGKLTVPMLFISTVINSTFEAFRSPAASAVTPLLLSKENYSYGMSLFASSSRIVEIVGLAAAGTIIGLFGVASGVIIDAASFIICGSIVLFINYEGDIIEKVKINLHSYFSDLKAGLVYLKDYKLLLNMVLLTPVINLLLVPFNTLALVYINSSLHLGAEAYSAINIVLTIGLACGNFLVPKIKEKVKGIYLLVSSGVLLGICYGSYYVLVNFSHPFIPVMIFSFGIGFAAGIMIMQLNVAFMERIDNSYIARTTGIMGALSMSSTPLGSFIVGGICLVFSTNQIFLLMGILTAIFFVAQLCNKSLRQL